MIITALFVLLQYVFGVAFVAIGLFAFEGKISKMELLGGIFYSYLVGYISMLIGVAIVGYFHLRVKHISRRFLLALTLSFVVSLLFLVLYFFIEKHLPKLFGFLALILPLTGAVFGFNIIATKYADEP